MRILRISEEEVRVLTSSTTLKFSPPAERVPMAYFIGGLPLLCSMEKDFGGYCSKKFFIICLA